MTPTKPQFAHSWSIVVTSRLVHLSLLDSVQKKSLKSNRFALSIKLKSLSHRHSVASLCLLYKYFDGMCSDEPIVFVHTRCKYPWLVRKAAKFHPLAVEIPRCWKAFYSYNFFLWTARLWNSLPVFCFSDCAKLKKFKCNVNRYLASQLPIATC